MKVGSPTGTPGAACKKKNARRHSSLALSLVCLFQCEPARGYQMGRRPLFRRCFTHSSPKRTEGGRTWWRFKGFWPQARSSNSTTVSCEKPLRPGLHGPDCSHELRGPALGGNGFRCKYQELPNERRSFGRRFHCRFSAVSPDREQPRRGLTMRLCILETKADSLRHADGRLERAA